jgi:hypothetical protein
MRALPAGTEGAGDYLNQEYPHPIAYTYNASENCPACTAEMFGVDENGFIPESARDSEGNPVGAIAPWDETENGITCDDCGKVIRESEPPRPDQESDAFISETRDGFSVSSEQFHLGTFADIDAAREFLVSWTNEHNYFPEMWEVNERGNTELLVVDPENPATLKHAGTGYV